MRINTKKLFKTTSVLCIMAMLLNTAVFADDSKETTVGVKFKGGSGPTNPVDPEQPENPGPGEPVEGDLAIVYASDFDFGEIELTTGLIQSYIPKADKPNIQVVDLRGTGAGWTLNARLSSLVDTTTANEATENQIVITGAKIFIENGRMNSTMANTYAPTPRTNVKLDADGTQATVMVAEDNKGQGLWVERFYPDLAEQGNDSFVYLEIPAGFNQLGEYKGTITWTLVNGPTS